MELHIEFNSTMGQITLYTNNRSNLEICDLNHFNNLGEIIQNYANEYVKDKYLNRR